MPQAIECAGHPRDMGLAQGMALRDVIRAEVARVGLPTRRSRWPSIRPLVSGPLRGQGAGRELIRHFAHQAERLEGLAQAADLPLDSLLELQLRMWAGVEPAWIVRESRPVVGFRSLEVTLPWLVTAVAGMNEAGLAVIARLLPAPQAVAAGAGGATATVAHRAGAAPPLLLVQDCLARFDSRAGAVDWCRKRPVEGEQRILLADASGARATVEVHGRERRVALGEDRLPVEEIGAGEIAGALGGASSGAGLARDELFVRIDPTARRLLVRGAGVFGGEPGRELAFRPMEQRAALVD